MMTFAQAKSLLLNEFQHIGWTVKKDLKFPHATSPDGVMRFWFKPQTVHYTIVIGLGGKRHEMGNARTLSYDQDIRKMSVDDLIAHVNRREG